MEIFIFAICIVGSVITSITVTKILATHYFEIVDSHVNEICKATREFVNSVLYK